MKNSYFSIITAKKIDEKPKSDWELKFWEPDSSLTDFSDLLEEPQAEKPHSTLLSKSYTAGQLDTSNAGESNWNIEDNFHSIPNLPQAVPPTDLISPSPVPPSPTGSFLSAFISSLIRFLTLAF